MPDKFKEQREAFENWLPKQFTNFDPSKLQRDFDNEYINFNMTIMFVGFCAGWELQKINKH